jgi:hypothetical protein
MRSANIQSASGGKDSLEQDQDERTKRQREEKKRRHNGTTLGTTVSQTGRRADKTRQRTNLGTPGVLNNKESSKLVCSASSTDGKTKQTREGKS